jgi:dTDP-4-amino-4,6-dideoxygalactose transaminase
LVDIEPEGYGIDPDQIEEKINSSTAAILPVHLYGNLADMGRILNIASQYSLPVIEDASQAHGAVLRGKNKAGSIGLVGCFSLYPSKILGACGDAGVITTNTKRLSERLRKFGTHGFRHKYYSDFIGINSRLDNLQAAILNVKMKYISFWVEKRREIAQRYDEALEGYVANTMGRVPWCEPSYYTYVVEVNARPAFIKRLNEAGVQTAIHYPQPIHMQSQYEFDMKQRFPAAEKAARRVVSLPCYPEMTNEQIDHVIKTVRGE